MKKYPNYTELVLKFNNVSRYLDEFSMIIAKIGMDAFDSNNKKKVKVVHKFSKKFCDLIAGFSDIRDELASLIDDSYENYYKGMSKLRKQKKIKPNLWVKK